MKFILLMKLNKVSEIFTKTIMTNGWSVLKKQKVEDDLH